ncbi:MAG TPA: Uma2 family endonuclease [Pirellulales bacterium]|nr:Uma2 family endonuclease [Pirellulales bacterium]
MATIPIPPYRLGTDAEGDYPTGDGKPLAETPLHRDNLIAAVKILQRFFAEDALAYVSGNMFVYYERGNRRKHVAPDVFVALGVPKDKPRDAYFVWQEAHGPDVVIELTSKSTSDEDLDEKMSIYQDQMPVSEYFLFDPRSEYLDPPLQGHRLRDGKYAPIEMVEGRLPSEVLGLHLERDGEWLRFYDPATDCWLPTPEEREAALESQLDRTEVECKRAEAERERLSAELQGSSQEIERLRRELEDWRRRFGSEANA